MAAQGARQLATGQFSKGGGTILDAIGNTPLVMVDGIWLKPGLSRSELLLSGAKPSTAYETGVP